MSRDVASHSVGETKLQHQFYFYVFSLVYLTWTMQTVINRELETASGFAEIMSHDHNYFCTRSVVNKVHPPAEYLNEIYKTFTSGHQK